MPPPAEYVRRYGAALNINANLRAVGGPARRAWVEVSPETLQPAGHGNVCGLGDARAAPNAKTAAAVRKQAPSRLAETACATGAATSYPAIGLNRVTRFIGAVSAR